MNNKDIELCNGSVAYYDETNDRYECKIHWLGREITFKLWCDEERLDELKDKFEQFWTAKEKWLSTCQKDIKETLIPYLPEAEPDPLLDYPKLTADDFDADYWLTTVCIYQFVDDFNMQLDFCVDADMDSLDWISVNREFDSDQVIFYVDGSEIEVPGDR